MHHAECIVGNRAAAFLEIPEHDRKIGPDVSYYEYTQLGIDEARALKYEAAQLPTTGLRRVFIVAMFAATHQAQNALLKLLEEPAPGVGFYLIVPKEDILIPTLRSRLNIRHTKVTGADDLEEAQAFLALPYAERLTRVAERTKDKEDIWCDSLVRGLEEVLRNDPVRGARALMFVEKYLRSPGASRKMLLEHLALTL